MALLGNAAMVLWFDIEPDAITEHDDWHSHEHLPERLSIPGFVRGSRWISVQEIPRYLVMYEVSDIGVLTSPRYLERLNHPTPWTAKMMPSYRGMTRGLCSVAASFGLGIGSVALSIRLSPAPGKRAELREWLTTQVLPGLPSRPGLASAHLFESAAAPEMTNEQKIRGKDAGVDWALLVTGYDQDTVTSLYDSELREKIPAQHGAGIYRLGISLTDREI